MEPNLLISSHKISPCIGALPFCISYKSCSQQKPKFSLKMPPVLSSRGQQVKTLFLGETLDFQEKSESWGSLKKTHGPILPVRASAVKWRKERPFDNVIQKEKKLKLVLKIRKILMNHPDRIMALRDLGRFRKALGLKKKRRFIALLRKFPAVFEIVEEGVYSLRFKLTPEAERLYLEEMRIRNEMEDLLVLKLRKLLMMSAEKRILLEKIAHLRTDLGLPFDFRNTICHRYPQYFKVVATGRGPALELTHWDPELAMTAAELAENGEREKEERDLIIDRPPKFNRVKLPRGLNLSRGEMRRISQFKEMPHISPYSDFSSLRSGTLEKEKHACAVVHEILSLTIEKRTLVDHLTHFRDEFRFSQQLRGMLVRHPDMFYVSLKGDRDSVFLREAYHDSQLKEKDRLLLIKEKLRALVSVPRFGRRGISKTGDAEGTEKGQGSGGEEEEWSSIDDFSGDGFGEDEDEDDDDGDGDGDDDDDDNDDDEWSDDEDDLPPDFDDDYDNDGGIVNREQGKPSKRIDDLKKKDGKVLIPVLPDGRPRERW